MTQPRPRLQRLKWYFDSCPMLFITACTHQRRAFLANDYVHNCWVEFAQRAANHQVHVGRYVLMPDHLHLFAIFGTQAIAVSAWVKSLKNALSKVLRAEGIAAPHWQKGFFDHVLRSAESYDEKWEYVRQNPVRKGLTASAEAWPYQGEIHALEWHEQ